jgi:hypothetical protein
LLQQGRPDSKGFRRRALGHHTDANGRPRLAEIPQAAQLGLEGLAEGWRNAAQANLDRQQAKGQPAERQWLETSPGCPHLGPIAALTNNS